MSDRKPDATPFCLRHFENVFTKLWVLDQAKKPADAPLHCERWRTLMVLWWFFDGLMGFWCWHSAMFKDIMPLKKQPINLGYQACLHPQTNHSKSLFVNMQCFEESHSSIFCQRSDCSCTKCLGWILLKSLTVQLPSVACDQWRKSYHIKQNSLIQRLKTWSSVLNQLGYLPSGNLA